MADGRCMVITGECAAAICLGVLAYMHVCMNDLYSRCLY